MDRSLKNFCKWVSLASVSVALELQTPRSISSSWKSARSGFEKESRKLSTVPLYESRASTRYSRYFSDTAPDSTAMAEARQTRSKTSAARSSESGAGADATKKLPVPENPLVIRTDFSDQAAWEAILKVIKTPTIEGFEAYVEFLDDPVFRGLTSAQLLDMVSEYKVRHSFMMIVDERTIAEPEHPLLVVHLVEDEADGDDVEPRNRREFRAVPSAIQGVENCLSIANMDFEDFADDVDEDGVFREFRKAAE